MITHLRLPYATQPTFTRTLALTRNILPKCPRKQAWSLSSIPLTTVSARALYLKRSFMAQEQLDDILEVRVFSAERSAFIESDSGNEQEHKFKRARYD